jgi:hypothetical protein
MKRYLGIDLREHQVALARIRVDRRTPIIEAYGAYARAPKDFGVVVKSAQAFDAENCEVIVSIDAQDVATQGKEIPPYIQPRDIPGYAELIGQRDAIRPERPRRIRYRRIGKHLLTISIANDKSVADLADEFESKGIMLHGMLDPAFAWLNSFAPCGIIDDAGGTTMIAYNTPGGTPVMDVVSRKVNESGLLSTALDMLRKNRRDAQYPHMLYFGDTNSQRFINLRTALLGLNIELFPVTPPERTTLEPWTFAAALGYCGACYL